MKTSCVLFWVFCLQFFLFKDMQATAQSLSNMNSVKRIAGTYKVASIQKRDNSFIVEFESESKSGKYDKLFFETDYIHSGIHEGSVMRISADLLKEANGTAGIAQVVLFFPTQDSHVPVWMLSKKAKFSPLKGNNYLEMHAPTSDYLVL